MSRLCLCLAIVLVQSATPRWTPLTTGMTARLRGVSAVNDRVVWASGANGTILRTADGGATWQALTIPGAEKLDFRDIDAVSDRTAYALSIGSGELSRIYKTSDAGTTWTEQFVNRDPRAFFDAMAFWDENRGVAVSDSVGGEFVILLTRDGGRTWSRAPAAGLPPALPNEGFFAASGTNVATWGRDHVWLGTGAAAAARVLRSRDGGRTWQLSPAPVAAGPSAGIFSIAFSDAQHGLIVGGDYKLEGQAMNNAAITSDGGITWTPVTGLSGFRSVVSYLSRDGRRAIAVGPSGSDVSNDGGATWTPLAGPGYHTFSKATRAAIGFAAGEKGTMGRLTLD